MRLVHKRRRQLALVLSALGAFVLGRACFVEIAEPVGTTDAGLGNGGANGADTSATGGQTGGSTSGGSGGTGVSGGSGGTGAVGGAAGAAGCGVNQVECGSLGCFDIANDLPTELTDAGVDGGFTWRMPKLGDDPAIDGDAADWGPISLVTINDVCATCGNVSEFAGNISGEHVVEWKVRPQAAELAAHFATGWTDAGIYVLAAVLDDEIYPPDDADAGALQGDHVDGIELFLDGVIEDLSTEGNEGFGPFAHHFFVGINGDLWAPSGSDPQPDTGGVAVAVKRSGNCYLVEARVKWSYLHPDTPTPQSGDYFRFDIGVNDWDTGDAGTAERFYQVLWRDPGINFGNVTNRYPLLTLD